MVSHSEGPTTRHCIIDTDVGWDDLVAIQALLRQPQSSTKVALMTTIHGCSSAHMGHQILQTVFPRIQSVAGEEEALDDERPEWVHKARKEMTEKCYAEALGLEKDNSDPLDSTIGIASVCEAIVELFLRRSNDDHVDPQQHNDEHQQSRGFDLICLGPLSNVAHLVDNHVDLVDKYIDRIYIMGGTLDAARSEFNFDLDPQAAVRVLTSSCSHKITLVTETVSQPTVWSDDFWKELDEILEQTTSKQLLDCDTTTDDTTTRRRAPRNLIQQILLRQKHKVCWDPICIYAYLYPHAVQTRQTRILVDRNTAKLRILDDGDCHDESPLDAGADVDNSIMTTINLLQYPPKEKAYLSWIEHLVRSERTETVGDDVACK